jgi:integrase
VEDVSLDVATITLRRPKVDLVQTHALTNGFLLAMRVYLTNDAPAAGALLRGSRKDGRLGAPGMNRQAIAQRVRALGEAAGVEGLSPHDCRHSWATRNVKHGLEWLQQAGGWSSLAMPARYVEAAKIANEGADID